MCRRPPPTLHHAMVAMVATPSFFFTYMAMAKKTSVCFGPVRDHRRDVAGFENMCLFTWKRDQKTSGWHHPLVLGTNTTKTCGCFFGIWCRTRVPKHEKQWPCACFSLFFVKTIACFLLWSLVTENHEKHVHVFTTCMTFNTWIFEWWYSENKRMFLKTILGWFSPKTATCFRCFWHWNKRLFR